MTSTYDEGSRQADRQLEVGDPEAGWPGLRADVDALGAAIGAARPARVAITSYEFNGVVRNGGIGTASTSLARALAEDGHEVELVFTGWADDPSDESFQRWQDRYQALGIALDRLDYATVANWDTVLYNTRHSLALYRLLRDRDRERPYDVIHFAESLGHGFYSLLAKRHGVAFERATTVVGVHSPRRWLAEAHGVAFDHPVELGDEHMERRSVELADVVVSPSAHMLGWLERRGTQLPARSYVQQYVTSFGSDDAEPADAEQPTAAAAVEELVFFGRLEPRKGLKVFCDALDLLAQSELDAGGLRRVTFLGKQVPLDDRLSGELVSERAQSWPWECTVIDDLDRDAALEYLGTPGRLAVMASLMDNSPNTVYEAVGLDISFLASRAGGTAELVHPDDFERVTYEPGDPTEREIDPGNPAADRAAQTGRVLARRLERALGTAPAPARYAVDPIANREAHLAWHRAAATRADTDPPEDPPAPEPIDVRNLAAVGLGDDMVLLLDPDAVPAPQLAATLAAAAAANPGTAFFTSLGDFGVETADGTLTRVLLPTGGPPPVGLLGNCFGAGAALARVDALQRMGLLGDTDVPAPATVADLLARAALAGERTDVVPEVLYELPAGAVPGGALTTRESALELLRPYAAELPPAARDIAGVAARLLREDAAVRFEAEQAVSAAEHANRRLTTVLESRSFRTMAPLRRAAARLRRRDRP